MKRRSTVEDWRNAVFADRHVSDRARVLLLLLTEYMRDDLSVSVPRATLAKRLGLSERRVADRFREAIGEKPEADDSKRILNLERRLLDRKVRGQKHVQAVYQGLMPDVLTMTPYRPAEQPPNDSHHDALKHAENPQKRHGENSPLSVESDSHHDDMASCLTTAEPSRGVENRNGGNDQESAPTGVSSEPAVCRWHPDEPCPADCANAPMPETSPRRSA